MMNIDEQGISPASVHAFPLNCDFFDLFNFFYSPAVLSSSWSRSLLRVSPGNTRPLLLFFVIIGRKPNFCCVCVIAWSEKRRRNVRNQRNGSSGEAQKDIKLKVVKTSSRFSIYFQLHSCLSPGCFSQLCSVERRAARWKEPESCECGLLPLEPKKKSQ